MCNSDKTQGRYNHFKLLMAISENSSFSSEILLKLLIRCDSLEKLGKYCYSRMLTIQNGILKYELG